MKTSIFALSALSIGSLVAAAPLKAKRDDIVWVTQVDIVTQVIESTITVWVDATPVPAPVQVKAPVSSAQNAEFFEKTRVAAPAPPATTFATSTSSSSSSSSSSTPAPSSTPVVVVAPSRPPQVVAPVQTTPIVVVAAPSTTAAPVAPPAPTVPSGGTGSGSSEPTPGGTAGSPFTGGDITYYDPDGGFGSCGTNIANGDAVVALPFGMMDTISTKSNGHPWCGKKVAIYYGGKTYYATVQDKCMGCKPNDIDMTSGLFKKVCGDSVDGRGKGVAKWAFVE